MRSLAYLASGALLWPPLALTLSTLLVLGTLMAVSLVGLALLMLAVALGGPVARLERRRLRLVDGSRLADPGRPTPGPGLVGWWDARIRDRTTWRELAYVLCFAVLLGPLDVAVVGVTALSAAIVALPLVVILIEPDHVMLGNLATIDSPIEALPLVPVGAVGLLASLHLAAAAAGAHAAAVRALLDIPPGRIDASLRYLRQSRARLVTAFEAERRRIERDLHDGAQRRLVALAITLGLAERALSTEDDGALALVRKARDEIRAALAELRELVRGIYPKVLGDLGLVAAIRDVVTGSAVPIRLDLVLPRHRLPDQVERAAYFVVQESLTNAVRHAGPATITITARVVGRRLVITVTDDGRGGADPTRGTGLQGLADRLAVYDGTVDVVSPPGGPTTVRARIPLRRRRTAERTDT